MKTRAPMNEIRILMRRAADLALHAPLDRLDAARAVMGAAINLSLSAPMSQAEVADWLRRLAEELEGADEAFGARVRELMRTKGQP